ncbi:MAG: ATP-binding protein, partial [Blastocatellales bacterium]
MSEFVVSAMTRWPAPSTAMPVGSAKRDWLAVRACQHGASVYFTTLEGMIRALSAADASGKLAQKLKSFTTKSQLLVIDEVGYLPLNRAEANYLFQVVAARYERSSLILTSNKAVSEWPELFGDHALATAIL